MSSGVLQRTNTLELLFLFCNDSLQERIRREGRMWGLDGTQNRFQYPTKTELLQNSKEKTDAVWSGICWRHTDARQNMKLTRRISQRIGQGHQLLWSRKCPNRKWMDEGTAVGSTKELRNSRSTSGRMQQLQVSWMCHKQHCQHESWIWRRHGRAFKKASGAFRKTRGAERQTIPNLHSHRKHTPFWSRSEKPQQIAIETSTPVGTNNDSQCLKYKRVLKNAAGPNVHQARYCGSSQTHAIIPTTCQRKKPGVVTEGGFQSGHCEKHVNDTISCQDTLTQCMKPWSGTNGIEDKVRRIMRLWRKMPNKARVLGDTEEHQACHCDHIEYSYNPANNISKMPPLWTHTIPTKQQRIFHFEILKLIFQMNYFLWDESRKHLGIGNDNSRHLFVIAGAR